MSGRPVQRQGDANSAGGVITSGVSSVLVNGRPIAVPDLRVSPHPCCGARGCSKHCAATTNGGSPSVRVNGRPVLRQSDKDSCGHTRNQGSPNVRVR